MHNGTPSLKGNINTLFKAYFPFSDFQRSNLFISDGKVTCWMPALFAYFKYAKISHIC